MSAHQCGRLYTLIQKGHASACPIAQAHMLFLANEQQPTHTMAAILYRSALSLTQTCKRFLSTGFGAAWYGHPRLGARRKLDAQQEALLVSLACSALPLGREIWCFWLLVDRVVELGIMEGLSYASVRRVLKKTTVVKLTREAPNVVPTR
jgi:hypothetical protein